MTAPILPVRPSGRDLIARAVQPQSTRVGPGPSSGYQPGMLERVLTMPLAAVTNPVGTARDAITGTIRDAITAALAPGVGELPHDPRLSKGGNSGGMTMPQMQTPYTAQNGGVTDAERLGAAGRLAVQALAPEAARLGAQGLGVVARGVANAMRPDPAALIRGLEWNGAMERPPLPPTGLEPFEIPFYGPPRGSRP